MFSEIAVALNEFLESHYVLCHAVELGRPRDAELTTVSLREDLPMFTSFAIVVDPNAPKAMRNTRWQAYGESHDRSSRLAQELEVRGRGSIVKGRDVKATHDFIEEEDGDLPVVNLHQHDSCSSCLWNSGYDLAGEAPCSVFGVH